MCSERTRGLFLRGGATLVGLTLALCACTAADPEPSRGARAVTRAPPASSEGSRGCAGLSALIRRVRRGYVPSLSPDINLVPRRPNFVGSSFMPAHSGPWAYLTRVPLVLYGPGFVEPSGEVGAAASMVDLAPTVARLIGYGGLRGRAGRVLDEALARGRGAPPALVVTLVWDGGGRNVLAAHPRSWPQLARLMRSGASYPRMDIGSSPSVTPPVHATLGTGAWPRSHGVPGLRIRSAPATYVDPLLYLDPSAIRLPTLGDLYDRARANRPVVGLLAAGNWHLGMVGHGAAAPGSDRDPVVLVDETGVARSNELLYSLPPIGDRDELAAATERLDGRDGRADGRWRGHLLDDPMVRPASPAGVAYHQWLLERLISSEGFGADAIPDLLYVNFKASDLAGHRWGPRSEEVGEVLRAQDTALGRLVRFLDERVGRRRWVLLLTADHGLMPYPRESGGWPVGGGELKRDANAALDRADDGVDLVDRVVSAGVYLRRDRLGAGGVGARAVARWLAGYTAGENHKGPGPLPPWYRGERGDRLFHAVMLGLRVAHRNCG